MVAATIGQSVLLLPSLCSFGEESRGRFRFRRYREEFALRRQQQQQQQQEIANDDENNSTHEKDESDIDTAVTKDDSTTNASPTTTSNENDGGGTVLQNLFDALVVIDECGNVSIEKKSSTTTIGTTTMMTTISSNEPNSNTKEGSVAAPEKDTQKGPDFPSVVPEGTTLLLRNLRDCRVTM